MSTMGAYEYEGKAELGMIIIVKDKNGNTFERNISHFSEELEEYLNKKNSINK